MKFSTFYSTHINDSSSLSVLDLSCRLQISTVPELLDEGTTETSKHSAKIVLTLPPYLLPTQRHDMKLWVSTDLGLILKTVSLPPC